MSGLWLGLMGRRELDLLDELYYEEHGNYVDLDYNAGGLFEWEAAALAADFPVTGRIVVTGAGAGREVPALPERGYDVVGYEPNPRLVAAGQRLLAERGQRDRLRPVARDAFPAEAGPCDAVVVGWSSYMLIPGRERRVAFLRGVRSALESDAPILLSFYTRAPNARRFRLRSAAPVEVGDALGANYAHWLIRDELASELHAAGFRIASYVRSPSGHAVAFAV